MYQIDFNKPIHIHFIGIGGISMSGLAELLLSENFKISGSDNRESALTRQLSDAGCNIFIGQKADNIDSSIDACVYTAAIHPDNPEYARCQELGIPMLSRAELLGQIMKTTAQPSVSQEHTERQPQHQCSVRYSCQQAPTQRYLWVVCSHQSEAI